MISIVTVRLDGTDYGPFTLDDGNLGPVALSDLTIGLQGSAGTEDDIRNLTVSSAAFGVGDIWSPTVTDGTMIPPFDNTTVVGSGSLTGHAPPGLWTFVRTAGGQSLAQAYVGSSFALGAGPYTEWYVQFDLRLRGLDALSSAFLRALVLHQGGSQAGLLDLYQADVSGTKHQWWNVLGTDFLPSGAPTGGSPPTGGSGGFVDGVDPEFFHDDDWHTFGIHVTVAETVPPPPPPAPALALRIYDLGVNVLADISTIALEKSLIRVANGPRGYTVQAPASDPLLTDLWEDGDGLPILGDGGNRKLVVWEDSDPDTEDPIFHGRIFGCERDGTENDSLVTITAFDPWVELGFETDERAGRPVRDGTATLVGDPSFFTPSFTSSVPDQDGISGPDLIRQVLTYSQGDPTTNPVQGEGPLPIDIQNDDNWELEVPPAIDLNPVDSADWPVMIGDFIQQLIATNAVDFDLRPIRPGTGRNLAGDLDDYIMVEASSKSKLGEDRTATVHFDYLTGSFNAKQARHVTDFSKHCDRLWYELGQRGSVPGGGWRGDITPHSVSVPDILLLFDASAAKYGGPDSPPGYSASIRVFDSLGTETSSRPLYLALYRYEAKLRVEPRQLLYITPCDGDKALFQAPQTFDAFDLVQIKTGPGLGKELDEAQRVYGYIKTWTRENVASIGQLQTSADVA